MTQWFERDGWCQDSGTLTGWSGCDMSAHFYNLEGSEIYQIQAIQWTLKTDDNNNYDGYKGTLFFLENTYQEMPTLPKRFWIKVIAYNQDGERAIMTFHHVELLDIFTGHNKAYGFIAQSKTKFEALGE